MSFTNFFERYSGNNTSGFSRRNLLFAFLIFLTRIPFVFAGPGTDEDAWGIALTALNIFQTHTYEVSRFPGFPVHELTSAAFIWGGPVMLNVLTAFMSSIAALMFVCALQEMRFRFPYLAGLAFAFTCIVFVHSSESIDYMWAMAFIMASFWMLLREKLFLSALLLAFATGCRITSLAMLLSFGVLLIDDGQNMKGNIRRMVRYALFTVIFSVIIYSPVLLKYGLSFFTYYDLSGYPSIPKVLYKLSLGVWGVTGILALLFGTLVLFFPPANRAGKYLLPRTINEKHVISWLVAMDMTILIFVRFPYESGYLIPLIPFTILVFGKYLYDKAFIYFCLLLMLSPFVIGISTSHRPDSPKPSAFSAHLTIFSFDINLDFLHGQIFTEQKSRRQTIAFANDVVEESQYLADSSLVLCGWWYNKVKFQYEQLPSAEKNNKVTWAHYLDKDELITYIQSRYNIFYLPLQDSLEKKMYGLDIKYFGAVPLLNSTDEEEFPDDSKPEP
jgi:hypothetical protein